MTPLDSGLQLLRPPETVMRLDRMGASHPTRLSFMRQLIRRMHEERAAASCDLWEIDTLGFGRAVYSLRLGGRPYSLCAFSCPLADDDRTDRVIAEAWDTTYVLYDGKPDRAELERIEINAMLQEAGRYSQKDLVLSRANKSVRMFAHVVDNLARGCQPDPEMVRRIGYLMRTTAVYGNGKFGLADRARIAERPEMAGPFQAEMLTVWLIRGFTLDLAQHIARCRRPDTAAALAPAARRHLGIGNATGLGMAPFLIGHPVLINNWMLARETALARVCAAERARPDQMAGFRQVFERALSHVAELEVDDAGQTGRNRVLRAELTGLKPRTALSELRKPWPWKRLMKHAESLSLECQELLVSLTIEPHGDIVDDLCGTMASATEAELDPSATVSELREIHDLHCAWANGIDFDEPDATRLFWYVSEEKLEPRLGDRTRDPGCERQLPLDTARQLQNLGKAVACCRSETVAEFLMSRPDLHHAVRRLQTLATCPYAEIRANLMAKGMKPVDLLRSKLAFFGATKFDPKSDLWTRITMFQGAPDSASITDSDADDWSFPALGTA